MLLESIAMHTSFFYSSTLGIMLSLGLICPSGGDFYICGSTTRFLGCCTSDPCTEDASCPQADLRYSSFNASLYPQILPQACMEHDVASWYTCDLEIPFLGCCSLNPCTPTGCPDGNLRAARLSDNSSNAEVFISDSHHLPTNLPPSETNLSTNPTATGMLKAPTSNTTEVKHSDLPLGAFIGIGIGGFVFCIACAGAILLLVGRRKLWFTRTASATATSHQHGTHLSCTSSNNRDDTNTVQLSLCHDNTPLDTGNSHGSPIHVVEHRVSPCGHDNLDSGASTCAAAREYQPYRPYTPILELDDTSTWTTRAYQPSRPLPAEPELLEDPAQRTARVYQPYRPPAPVVEQQMLPCDHTPRSVEASSWATTRGYQPFRPSIPLAELKG